MKFAHRRAFDGVVPRPLLSFFHRLLQRNNCVRLERISGNLFLVTGGFANTFLFFTDKRKREAILIDPSVSEEFMRDYYFKEMENSYANAVVKAFKPFGASLPRILSDACLRVQFLRRLFEELKNPENESPSSNQTKQSFESRGIELARLLESHRVKLQGIFVTHAHIDHLGVASVLQKQLREYGQDVRIFVPDTADLESRVHTNAVQDLLLGKGNGEPAVFSPYPNSDEGIQVVGLDGHSRRQNGLVLPNGFFIVGDLIGPENGFKRMVYYLEDFAAHVHSLDTALQTHFSHMLLSHGATFVLSRRDSLDLLEANERHILWAKQILEECGGDVFLAEERAAQLLRLEEGRDFPTMLQLRVQMIRAFEGYATQQQG